MSTTNINSGLSSTESPFHRGEQEIQTRLGVRQNMERFGRMVIRDYMPEEHIDFYQNLPFVFVGHADTDGNAWASILFNPPGFIQAQTNQLLKFNTKPIKGDPLATTLAVNSSSGISTKLGILGIELNSRRRNRLAGHVIKNSNDAISLQIDQAFGNCPQYIQSREYRFISETAQQDKEPIEQESLNNEAVTLIEQADTFFIASYVESNLGNVSDGADVSHRGGRPGFVRVNNGKTLTFPDYLGNNHFNTLGNISENSKAGLLFLDFINGHLLTLTGTAKIIWDSDELTHFEGAERLVEFKVDKAITIFNGLPIRWSNVDFSANSLLTGTWQETEEIKKLELTKNQWQNYTVLKTINESNDIRSFYLDNSSGLNPKFKPGQFLTVKANIFGKDEIRTYTVSSAPDDEQLRISVKREQSKSSSHPDGIFSNYMHNNVLPNATLTAKAPAGSFYFDPRNKRPAILMAAGVGITPMISMLRQALIESIKTRYLRPIILIAVARNKKDRAFYDELKMIVQQSSGQINVYWFLTQPEESLIQGKDYFYHGRPNNKILSTVIVGKSQQAYLCGPSNFMQSSYEQLRKHGVKNHNIFAESFGPSTLQRDNDIENTNIAKQAIVTIKNTSDQTVVEQRWSSEDGSLLEFMESHGLSPSYGCRSGRCGACKSELISGEVEDFIDTTFELGDNEILLCTAKPAKNSSDLSQLEIKLI